MKSTTQSPGLSYLE